MHINSKIILSILLQGEHIHNRHAPVRKINHADFQTRAQVYNYSEKIKGHLKFKVKNFTPEKKPAAVYLNHV